MSVSIPMRNGLRVIGAVAALWVAPTVWTAESTAEPATDPCQLAVSLLCRFIPMAPELDSDVDLTRPEPIDSSGLHPAEDYLAPDFCSFGCM